MFWRPHSHIMAGLALLFVAPMVGFLIGIGLAAVGYGQRPFEFATFGSIYFAAVLLAFSISWCFIRTLISIGIRETPIYIDVVLAAISFYVSVVSYTYYISINFDILKILEMFFSPVWVGLGCASVCLALLHRALLDP